MLRTCEFAIHPGILSSSRKKLALRTRYKRSPGMGDTSWVAEKTRESPAGGFFSRLHNLLSLRRHGIVRTAAHQDESPAEYSLAGCSPAAPASAFPVAPYPQRKPSVCQAFFSERLTVTLSFVSIRGAVQ
jgi:hypothetical protein